MNCHGLFAYKSAFMYAVFSFLSDGLSGLHQRTQLRSNLFLTNALPILSNNKKISFCYVLSLFLGVSVHNCIVVTKIGSFPTVHLLRI